MPTIPQLTRAEENELATRQIIHNTKGNLLKIGLLLLASQEEALWSVNKHETFRNYVESLGVFSYSWATRLVGIARLLRDDKLTAQDIDQMGLGKAAMLLPHKLTPELIELAKNAPPSDLRQALQGELREAIEEGKYIQVHCDRCGADFRWRVK